MKKRKPVKSPHDGYIVGGVNEDDLRELIAAMKRAIESGFNFERAGLSADAWERIQVILPPICPTCGRLENDE